MVYVLLISGIVSQPSHRTVSLILFMYSSPTKLIKMMHMLLRDLIITSTLISAWGYPEIYLVCVS